MRFASFLLILLSLSACRSPVLPDGEICAMIDVQDQRADEVPHLLCILRSNQTKERMVTTEEAYHAGYIAVSPEYYAEIEQFRKDTKRWMERNCK